MGGSSGWGSPCAPSPGPANTSSEWVNASLLIPLTASLPRLRQVYLWSALCHAKSVKGRNKCKSLTMSRRPRYSYSSVEIIIRGSTTNFMLDSIFYFITCQLYEVNKPLLFYSFCPYHQPLHEYPRIFSLALCIYLFLLLLLIIINRKVGNLNVLTTFVTRRRLYTALWLLRDYLVFISITKKLLWICIPCLCRGGHMFLNVVVSQPSIYVWWINKYMYIVYKRGPCTVEGSYTRSSTINLQKSQSCFLGKRDGTQLVLRYFLVW